MGSCLESLSDEQLLGLVSAIVDEKDAGYCIIDRDYHFVWASPNFLSVYGKSEEQIKGMPAAWIFGQEYFDTRGRGHYDRCFQGDRIDDESWVDFPPRGKHYFKVAIRPLYLEEGDEVSHLLWAERDLTRHRGKDDDLFNESRKLDCIVGAMQAGTWVWNIQTGESWYNDRWAEILGYRLDEIGLTTRETWQELVHPEDFVVSARLLEEHFSGKTDFYRCEIRMRHKLGHWVWIESRGRVYQWSGGHPLLMFGSHIDISDEKEQEASTLRMLGDKEESERRLSKVTNSIPGAVIVYRMFPDGWDELAYVNDKLKDIYGIEREDAIRDVSLLWKCIHSEDVLRLRRSIEVSAKNLSFWDEVWRIQTPDGVEKVVNGRGRPHREADGGVVWDAILLDLTDLHETKDQLEAANLRMTVAKESAGIGVWEIGLKDDMVVWDDGMYRLYGANRSDQPDPKAVWETYVHEEDKNRADTELLRAIENETPYENTLRVVHEDGRVCHLYANATVVYDELGVPERVVGINYDITDRVEAEERLRESERIAREANEAKSRFLSVMNHEMRTPLNSIIAPIEILEDSDLDPSDREVLSLVRPAAEHLLSLINDILSISKIEAGQYKPNFDELDPAKFIREKMQGFFVQAENKSIRLEVQADPDLPAKIFSDPYALTQILNNLVSNALKFTPHGGIVTVSLSPLLSEDSSGGICLRVTDSGQGVPEDQLSEIFEPFHQVNAQPEHEDLSLKGTGLGLAICRDLAIILGGSMSAKSQVGEGSEFTLSIPDLKATNESG